MSRFLGASQASKLNEPAISRSEVTQQSPPTFPDRIDLPQSLENLHPQVRRFYERYTNFYNQFPAQDSENKNYSGNKR